MLSTLEARRAEVDRNPSLIYGMIESILAPHFDFERITQGRWASTGARRPRAAAPAGRRLQAGAGAHLCALPHELLGEEIRYLPVKPG
jgi:phospholipid transport system substrate-binding protein